MDRIMTPDRLVPVLVLAVSLGALAVALIAEHIFGLAPCPLCLYQRIPYAFAALVAVMAVASAPDAQARRRLVGVCAGLFLVGSGIAGYHVGVEQGWWAGTPACIAAPLSFSVEELRRALSAPVVIPCDVPAWTLFGVSMAGYNMAASLVLAALCALAIRRPEYWRPRP